VLRRGNAAQHPVPGAGAPGRPGPPPTVERTAGAKKEARPDWGRAFKVPP